MNDTSSKTIDIARDYTRFPAGRFLTDGPFSGERFRQEILKPALEHTEVVEVVLDGVAGYGSSFLDEAFGGLVREHVVSQNDVLRRIKFRATDESLVNEILSYMMTE